MKETVQPLILYCVYYRLLTAEDGSGPHVAVGKPTHVAMVAAMDAEDAINLVKENPEKGRPKQEEDDGPPTFDVDAVTGCVIYAVEAKIDIDLIRR